MSVLGDLMYLLNTDAKLSAVLNVSHTQWEDIPQKMLLEKKGDPSEGLKYTVLVYRYGKKY